MLQIVFQLISHSLNKFWSVKPIQSSGQVILDVMFDDFMKVQDQEMIGLIKSYHWCVKTGKLTKRLFIISRWLSSLGGKEF